MATVSSPVLSRATLLGLAPKRLSVHLPDELGHIYVRQINAGEQAKLVKGLDRSTAGALEMMAALVFFATINEDGSQFFSSRQEVDSLPANIVQVIADGAMTINNMAKPQDETVKN